ncbi:MAG: PHP domain-containing protein [Caldisericia bacterium]|nr:PHP domain-containing protein [Caldisericia bacterium]
MADLHIHSTLSPCGSLEMSPKKIIERAYSLGINLISITDHNSIESSYVASEISKKFNINYLFGMEVQTKEEIHVLIYFDNIDDILEIYKTIYEKLPDVKNNPEIFGDQVVVDEDENIIKFEEKLLLNSVDLSLNELNELVSKKGGLFIPAHINSETFSIISQIGFIPEDLEIDFLEITYNVNKEDFLKNNPVYSKYRYLSFSDSHYLNEIGRSVTIFELDYPSISSLKKIDNEKILIKRR